MPQGNILKYVRGLCVWGETLLKCPVCGSEDLEEYYDGSGKCLYCGKAYFDLQGQIAKGLVGELSPSEEKETPEKAVVDADEKEQVSFDEVLRRRRAATPWSTVKPAPGHRHRDPQLAKNVFLTGVVLLLLVAFLTGFLGFRVDQLLSEVEALMQDPLGNADRIEDLSREAQSLSSLADVLLWVHLLALILVLGGAWMFMTCMTPSS